VKAVNRKFILVIYGVLIAAWAFLALKTFIVFLGIQAFNRGDYASARGHFKNPLVNNRKLTGITYYKENLFEQAFDYYQKINDTQGMGLAYLGMKNYDKAIEYFDKTGYIRGKGLALMGQKKYKEAQDIFEKAGDKVGLGLAYLSVGELDKAQEAFEDSSDAFGLGVVLFMKGERYAAMKAFQKSNNETARGMSYLLRGDVEKARKYFARKSDLTINGFFNTLIGNYDKAAEIYIYSKDERKHGQLLTRLGRYGEAYEKLSGISDYESLGELFFRVRDYERAFEYFKKAQNAKRAFDCLVARGDVDRAMDFAKETLQKEFSSPRLGLSLAEVYRMEGKQDFALQELEKVAKKKGYGDVVSIYDARTYFSGKDYDAASAEIKGLESLYDDQNWVQGIQLSARNLNEITGKEIVSVQGKGEKETKPEPGKEELPEEAEEEEEPSAFPWTTAIFVMILLLAGGGFGTWMYYAQKYGVVKQRKSVLLSQEIMDKVRQGKPKEEDIVSVAQVLGLEDFRFDGIAILLNVMKRSKVKAVRDEIVELSGEGEDKLSVYGIYLASRAKGLAVKGIKVDFKYLRELQNPVIVFFHDETFAHVVNITEQALSLDFGIDKLFTVKHEDFFKIWNDYVMIFGASQ
jgi:tetratricopeptide (TPR) repeat protein